MKGPGNQTCLFSPLNSGCLSLTLKDKTRRAGKHMQMHTCERREDKGTDGQGRQESHPLASKDNNCTGPV